jgi:hypothetical protein
MSLPEASLLWVSTHWSEMMVRKKPQWNSKRGIIATLTDCLYHREDACNGLCMKVGEWWKIPELEDSGSSYSLQKVNGNILCFALCFFFMFLFVLLFSYQVGHLSSRYQQIGFTVFEHFLFINEIVLHFTSFICLFFFQKNMHFHLPLSGNMKADHPRNP